MASIAPPHNDRAIFDFLFPTPGSSNRTSSVDDRRPAQHVHPDRREALALARKFLSTVTVREAVLSPEGVSSTIARLEASVPNDVHRMMEIALLDWPDLDRQDDDIVDWYLSSVRNDFYIAIEPVLNETWSQHDSVHITGKLQRTCEIVMYAQQVYTFPVSKYMIPALDQLANSNLDNGKQHGSSVQGSKEKLTRTFSNFLQPVFLATKAAPSFYDALTTLTVQSCFKYFKIDDTDTSKVPKTYEVNHEAGLQLMQMFEHLNKVGLGGKPASRAFAEAVEHILVDFIDSSWMQVDWKNRKSVIHHLTMWVEKVLAPFIQRGQVCLNGIAEPAMEDKIARWLELAVAWLGRSRISNLYSYVSSFPRSSGALQDIKAYITTPDARRYLTMTFQQDVERRLLHAGATTKHILDMYILLIQTFITIDSRGVLLDNVSRPVRRYLKSRPDTAKIIIASMLTDGKDFTISNSNELSLAISAEMDKPLAPNDSGQRQDSDLDFDNMEYLPQAIDASPEFVRNQSNDAISHLLSLYDKEQFVNVLKGIFGEHLLRTSSESSLTKEQHLLRLFKSRFGEDKLQACDVMLQDIINSRDLSATINSWPQFTEAAEALPIQGHDLTAQVLSSFFWPELRDDEFALPMPVKQIQELYEQGFMHRHSAMKLKWLPSLGRATVELQLEDRVVSESVPTWVASVIYAFDDSVQPAAASKSIGELAAELDMDEPLVRNAIAFWVGKRVLQEAEGRFHVLESLPDDTAQDSVTGRGVVMQEEVSAVKSAQDVLEENAEMYMMFVQGMLMNQGAMPVPRILMMLKIALPGGFPFGDTEVKTLLQNMVGLGRLVQNGESYGVKK